MSAAKNLREVMAVMQTAGLRPIADPVICVVRADCPVCDAGTADPLGIHRPLEIGCWVSRPEHPVRLNCSSGCDPAAIRRALQAPPVDWRALSAEYEALAADCLAALDAALAQRECPLAVAA